MNRRTFLKTTGLSRVRSGDRPPVRRPGTAFQNRNGGNTVAAGGRGDGHLLEGMSGDRRPRVKATEADNTLADLDTTYGTNLSEFEKRTGEHGVKLVGVYHSMQLHEPDELPAMRQKAAAVAKFLKSVGAG